MGKFHVLVHSLLLVTSPSLLAYPQCEQTILEQVYDQEKLFDDFNVTYDEILELLQDIEEENIEEISEEKIERITLFIAFLAQKGKLPGEYAANLELENDIAGLFENKDTFIDYARDCEFAYASNFNFSCGNADNFAFENAGVATLLNGGNGEKASLYGKSNSQKKAEKDAKKNVKKQENNSGHHDHKHRSGFTKIKDFIVKHRKAIIIGAIIIVAVTAVIVAVAVLSPAGAAAAGVAGGAVAGASTTGSDRNEQDKPEENEEEQDPFSTSSVEPEMPSTSDMPVLVSVIEESISNFKETVVEEDLLQTSNQSQGHEDAALEEIARNLGSTLAHQALDGIAGLVSFVPELLEEIKNVGNQIFPESILASPVSVEITPRENFENMLADGHNGIDEFFSTNQAILYTPEAKESGNKYVIGILPPPGILTNSLVNTGKFAEVVQLERRISEWLGEGTKLIRNKAGDPVFLSKDGLKRVRFDFSNPHGDKPHLHIEEKLDERWHDASSKHRIYPTDE